MITTMFFILVPFLKRAPCIIIHLARNAEKGGGVLMSIILPNLNHSFVPVPVPFPDSGSVSGIQISWFSIRPLEDLGMRTVVCAGTRCTAVWTCTRVHTARKWIFFSLYPNQLHANKFLSISIFSLKMT